MIEDTNPNEEADRLALETLAKLAEHYPAAFSPLSQPPKPLAIGIAHGLERDLPLSRAVISAALKLYIQRWAYQEALAVPGAMRVDLTGQPVEPVSDTHQKSARGWLAVWRERGTDAPRPKRPRKPRPKPRGPLVLTWDLWEGLKAMAITATLKLVLRTLPRTRERDGFVFMMLENQPRDLPARVKLEQRPLLLTCTVKQWAAALQRFGTLSASGATPLLLVEAHVGTNDAKLLAVAKAVQVVEGKRTEKSAGTVTPVPAR